MLLNCKVKSIKENKELAEKLTWEHYDAYCVLLSGSCKWHGNTTLFVFYLTKHNSHCFLMQLEEAFYLPELGQHPHLGQSIHHLLER
jgi:hypothetical protein